MSQVVELHLGLQLADICNQFRNNSLQATRLELDLHPSQLNLRVESDSWSIAECLVHLNLISETFVPTITSACEQARVGGVVARGPYKMDVVGRLLKYSLEPPSKWNTTTSIEFEPVVVEPLGKIIPRFLDLQSQLMTMIEAAADLDLNRIKITSPISNHVRYNLYSCFLIIAAHQRRHLWQAGLLRSALLSNGKRR